MSERGRKRLRRTSRGSQFENVLEGALKRTRRGNSHEGDGEETGQLLPLNAFERQEGKTTSSNLTVEETLGGMAGAKLAWGGAIMNSQQGYTYDYFLEANCRLQGDSQPLKIVRARNQYIYDEADTPYLDCVNSVAHVGHCHPAVVEAMAGSMGFLTECCGWDIDHGEIRYPKDLQPHLPKGLNTFLFCNSGSEAVDLAVQLARLHTQGSDVLVVDNAFHGSIDSVHHLSPKVSKTNNISSVDWVHVVAMPDTYKGPYQVEDPQAVKKYLADARDLVDRVRLNGRKIACFIAEPLLTVAGCIWPPNVWLQDMYKMVREAGGLCIADEVQTGLGRIGSHLWSFEAQGVTPDILIIGKAIGNGYPMACVVTSQEIASHLGNRVKEYKCSAVMNAVGCTVLNVMQQEQLMASAASVGSFLQDELVKLKRKHEFIGDVRGSGLLFGVELVWSKRSKKPAREIAELVVSRLKNENIIIANEGDNRNILMIMPPMCFSQENATVLTEKLDKVLTQFQNDKLVRDRVTDTPSLSLNMQAVPGTSDGRIGIIQPQDEDDDALSTSRERMDLEYAQDCYYDLD